MLMGRNKCTTSRLDLRNCGVHGYDDVGYGEMRQDAMREGARVGQKMPVTL